MPDSAPPGRGEEKACLPLAGILVIDFSQFLSGPSASLRLADLGARVIKVERPQTGDICRRLYVSDVMIDGESTVFHAINRNKESFSADLKDSADRERVRKLVARADVILHNFRPGVIERLGFDYASVRTMNPRVVYGWISGYSDTGPWREKPGQDLLLQCLSGLAWFTGNRGAGPVPMGISIVDIYSGAQLVQGILACLLRREHTGLGGLVEISMLESIIDFQFEPLTLYWQDGGREVQRTRSSNAHPLLGAPYGVYETSDGHLALAMGSIIRLGELLGCEPLRRYEDPSEWFEERDAIKEILATHLRQGTTAHWLAILEPADIWCAEVLNYHQLTAHEGYRSIDMEQAIIAGKGRTLKTTRCPIRINGQPIRHAVGAPAIGQHNESINREFGL